MNLHTTRGRVRAGAALAASAAVVALPAVGQAAHAAGRAPTNATAAGPVLPATGNAIGWTAAIQHQSGPQDNRGQLVMVAPTGGIVKVGAVSDDAAIQDVTLGGHYVITARTQDEQTRVTVWDTHTKKPTYFRVPGEQNTIAFGSSGIIVAPNSGKAVTVRTYAGVIRTRFADVPVNSADYVNVAVSPDGRNALEAGTKLNVRDGATGRVTKTVNLPAGYRSGQCNADRSWTAGGFLVTCNPGSLGDDRSYVLTSSGALSAVLAESSNEVVWPTSAGVVSRASSETTEPYVLHGKTGNKALPLPPYADVVGSRGAILTVLTSSYPGSTLFTYDVTTGARKTLAGTAATGGGRLTDGQAIDGAY